MIRILGLITLLISTSIIAQEPVDTSFSNGPSEEFLNKLDSIGGMDSVAYAQIQFNKGVENMNQKKFNIAISYFDSSIYYNPAFVQAYFNRGLSYLKKG